MLCEFLPEFYFIFLKESSMNFDLEICSHEFPTISEMTLYIFLSFCTAYLCEVVFSALAIINQNILSTLKNVEDALHPAV